MISFIRLFFRALPFVAGIICTLMALSFLIEFTSGASNRRDFMAFVIFAGIGLPLTLYGIDRLSRYYQTH